MIDGGVTLDLEAVLQNVSEADVISVYFPMVHRSLLIDTRTAPGVSEFVGLVPIAGGSAERVRSIKRIRPQLPRPQSITMIPWMRRVHSLVTSGVWAELLARVDDREAAEECYRALCALEKCAIRDAIIGHEYRSLWTRGD